MPEIAKCNLPSIAMVRLIDKIELITFTPNDD